MEEDRLLLSDGRYRLRKPEPEDLEFLYRFENDTEFWNVGETKTPYSRWEMRQYIANSQYDIYTIKELRLIIDDMTTGQQAGCIDLFEYSPAHNRAGVGIMIDKNLQHTGIGMAALKMLQQYAFNILNINQLWSTVDYGNEASQRLFEKANFHHTATIKQWRKIKQKYHDVLLYQCFKEDIL